MKDLKDELYRVEKEGLLIDKMQQQLTSDIDITPEEVKRYFISLEEEGNLPEIGAEIELSQIVLNIEPTKEEIQKTIDRLKEIKKEVEDGGNFKMKAILYSDDPGVTQNSGFYSIERNSPFVKEFKEAAFSMEEGEISQPFKSDFGYHILMVDKINNKPTNKKLQDTFFNINGRELSETEIMSINEITNIGLDNDQENSQLETQI